MSLLYESDAVAYDTTTHLFVNPKAGTTYGPNDPNGSGYTAQVSAPPTTPMAPAVTGSGYVSATATATSGFDLTAFLSNYGLWIAGGLGALWLFGKKR